MSEWVGARGTPRQSVPPLAKTVRFVDPVMQKGFTQIPNDVLRDFSLSVPARLTYALLSSFAWQDESCWPGQKKLGKLLRVSDRQLRKYIRELEGAKLVRVHRRGLKKTNLYLLLDRNSGSAQDRKPSSDKEDPREEDNGRGTRDVRTDRRHR